MADSVRKYQSMRAIFAILIFFMFFGSMAKASNKTVQISTLKLRQDATLFSPVTGELKYLDEVSVLENRRGWTRIVSIKNKKLSGWVQNASLTEKTALQLKADSQISVDENTVTLAGKGFSSQHEKAMKKKNKKLDFSKVDRVEKIDVSDAQFKNFVTTGDFKRAKRKEASQ